jgi:hypothetical protein
MIEMFGIERTASLAIGSDLYTFDIMGKVVCPHDQQKEN